MMQLIKAFLLSLLFAAQANAAIVNFTGFELGSGEALQNAGGTFSFSTTNVKTATYSFKTNPATTAVGWASYGALSTVGLEGTLAKATIWTNFNFLYVTKAAATNEEIFTTNQNSGTIKLEVRLNSSGQLEAYDKNLVLMATGTTVLLANTYYRISVKSGTGASAAWEVQINGVAELSGTGDLQTNNNAIVVVGKGVNRNGNSVEYYYDDLSIDDAAYPGDARVKTLLPLGTGSTQQWTAGTNASGPLEVDEQVSDADTTYVKNTVSAGDVALFTLQSTTTTGITGTIAAVKSIVVKREDTAVTSASSVRLRSGGVNSDTAAEDVTSSYLTRQKLILLDPGTAAAWTLAGVDTIEVGVVEANAASLMRATVIRASVLYAPPSRVGNLPSLGAGS